MHELTGAQASRETGAISTDGVGARPASWRWDLVFLGVMVTVLSVPLLVALVAIRDPRWYPLMDMAQVELRVRDVGSSQPPLIGLKGRFVLGDGRQASHPGPLAFWLLWPIYRVAGGTSWAMQVATVLLQLAATATALWIALRRGGPALVLGVATTLAVLMRAFGALTLTEAWIPHLPLLWWVVFVLAVWSIVSGDTVLVPVAVFAGSLCVQSHVSHVGTVVGLGILAAVVGALATIRRAPRDDDRSSGRRWILCGIVLGTVLWVPPIVEQLTRSPGNLSSLWRYFTAPGEPPVGLRSGVELLLVHHDPWRLVTGQVLSGRALVTGSTLPGALMLGCWAIAAIVAIRLRHRPLVRLHLVIGAAIVMAGVSMSRIVGDLWYYLVLWGWALGALVGFVTIWTLVVLVARHQASLRTRWPRRAPGKLAMCIALVISTAVFTGQASRVEVLRPDLSSAVGELVPSTVAALAEGSIPGTGRDGRYLVTWTDPFHLGTQGWALLNELDRHGFDVAAVERYRAQATEAHIRSPDDATAVVNLAVGSAIEEWRGKAGVHEIAYFDARTGTERSRYARLRSVLIRELKAAGLDELVPAVDENAFALANDPALPESTRSTIVSMRRIGVPTAVFVGPPEAVSET